MNMNKQLETTDMTVEEFYSGFNLDFMSEEERQTIYTATELYAKGKLRQASLTGEENPFCPYCGKWERLPVDTIAPLCECPAPSEPLRELQKRIEELERENARVKSIIEANYKKYLVRLTFGPDAVNNMWEEYKTENRL